MPTYTNEFGDKIEYTYYGVGMRGGVFFTDEKYYALCDGKEKRGRKLRVAKAWINKIRGKETEFKEVK